MPDSPADSARVAFRIPPELAAQVEEAVTAVRDDPDARDAVNELIEAIIELTKTGLDYYFLHPLELAGVGTVSLTSARLGVAAAHAGIPRVVKRVVGSMSEEQLLSLCDFLDEIRIADG